LTHYPTKSFSVHNSSEANNALQREEFAMNTPGLSTPSNLQAFSESQPIPLSAPEAFWGRKAQWLLRWCPLGATTAQVVPCIFLLTLSGYRTAIGGLALFSASIAGPFELFHRNAVRIPFFLVAGGLSLLNLYMYYYAKRRREMSSARWRRQPLSTRERRTQIVQLSSSLLTLGMIAADFVAHRLHALGHLPR
jgi:hypothetical protein